MIFGLRLGLCFHYYIHGICYSLLIFGEKLNLFFNQNVFVQTNKLSDRFCCSKSIFCLNQVVLFVKVRHFRGNLSILEMRGKNSSTGSKFRVKTLFVWKKNLKCLCRVNLEFIYMSL